MFASTFWNSTVTGKPGPGMAIASANFVEIEFPQNNYQHNWNSPMTYRNSLAWFRNNPQSWTMMGVGLDVWGIYIFELSLYSFVPGLSMLIWIAGVLGNSYFEFVEFCVISCRIGGNLDIVGLAVRKKAAQIFIYRSSCSRSLAQAAKETEVWEVHWNP